MRGDFSRWTFDSANHFTRVLMQQGRVQLDADWNEQVSILLHYMRTLAQDVMGPHGTSEATHFAITPNDSSSFTIAPGRYYVEGILCEDGETQSFEVTGTSPYLVYLDVWERHVTHVEHDDRTDPTLPGIHEAALRSADTTTRTQVIWQVRVEELKNADTLISEANTISSKQKAKSELETDLANENPWPEQDFTQFTDLVAKLNEIINTFDSDGAGITSPTTSSQVYLKEIIDPIFIILREMQLHLTPLPEWTGNTPLVADRINTINQIIYAVDRKWEQSIFNPDDIDEEKLIPDPLEPSDFYLKTDLDPFLNAVRNVITALQNDLSEIVDTTPYSDADATLTRMVKEHRLQQLEKDVYDANQAIQQAVADRFNETQSTATLTAQIEETEAGDDDDEPCIIRPDAQYRGPENQLYRVEIHQGNINHLGEFVNDEGEKVENIADARPATFKWSRENGSVVFPITSLTGKTVTVAHLGRDDTLGLRKGDWVEIVDDNQALKGEAGHLAEIEEVKSAELIVILKNAVDVEFEYDENSNNHPLLRRWESGTIDVAEGEWQTLEQGIEVSFSEDGTYKTGDYWLIPARTETANIEWPKNADGTLRAMRPLGIEHHYAPLAILTSDGDSWTAVDCRRIFKPLWQPAGV